jgi:protein required for attachment to host cells
LGGPGAAAEQGFHAFHADQALYHGRRKQTVWLVTANRQKASVYQLNQTTSRKTYRKKTRSLDLHNEVIQGLELVASAQAEITPLAAGAQKNKGRLSTAGNGDVYYGSNPRDRENHHDDKIFIRDLVLWLDEAEKAQAFDKLIIAATPRTQGDLHGFLTENVQNCLLTTLSKDLTTMTLAEIQRYLDVDKNIPLA